MQTTRTSLVATIAYLGPTDTEGSRFQVRHNGHLVTVPYDYAASDPLVSAWFRAAEDLGIDVPHVRIVDAGSTRWIVVSDY